MTPRLLLSALMVSASLLLPSAAIAQDVEQEDELLTGDPDAVELPEEGAPVDPADPSEPPPLGDVAGAGPALEPGKDGKEEICDDGVDNDEDSMPDCADADCREAPNCKPGQGPEQTDQQCTDWVDNDDDGFVDCDDEDCYGGVATACEGSHETKNRLGPELTNAALNGTGLSTPPPATDVPQPGEGQTVIDMLGKGDDKDGERNDFVCADGIDNDGDGMIDCADIGCRFDPQVSVCRGAPGLRFSVVAQMATSATIDRQTVKDLAQEPGYLVGDVLNDAWNTQFDTRITALQLRAFGPIPGIQDSFFLLSGRAERTPRLTFAMASFPIGWGHFININSGGGGLSNNLVLSQHKRALIDSPFYLYNAFEQGNGAAIVFNGPIIGGWLDYRVFAAGGAGFFNGNVGGRFFSFDNRSYTFAGGAQMLFTPIGFASRWDTQYLYTPVPAAWLITAGARFDRRAQEMFPAVNISTMFRWWHFTAMAESYSKYELIYGSAQTAWNVMLGALIWPKWVFWAFDIGSYYATRMATLPATLETDLRRQRNEFMWRTALHFYFYKQTGIASIVLRDRYVGPGVAEGNADWLDLQRLTTVYQSERQVKLVMAFRF